MFYDLIST